MTKYVFVWIVLAVLTVATFLLAHAPLGPFHAAVALFIASVKSVLVVLFFMHIVEHKGAAPIVFGTAVIFVLVIVLFTVGDVATRFPLALPRR
jgi:cytochrome c oxidase subunit 4